MKSLLLGIGLILTALSRVPLAQAEPAAEGVAVLAGVSTPNLDYSRLGRMFDSMKPHMRDAVIPKPKHSRPRNRTNSVKSPPRRRGVKIPARSARPKKKLPRANVPAPNEIKPYRRTFKRLLAKPEITDRYDDLIVKYALAYRLDPRLLKSIMAAESEFSIGAVSHKGARGLMQLMPATAEQVGVPAAQLHTPEFNIRAGAAYLARLFSSAWKKYKLKGVRYHDAPDWIKQRIIAAYNAGPRFLFSNRWYAETRDYVRKVMLLYRSKVTEFRRPPRTLSFLPKTTIALTSGVLY